MWPLLPVLLLGIADLPDQAFGCNLDIEPGREDGNMYPEFSVPQIIIGMAPYKCHQDRSQTQEVKGLDHS